LVLDSSGEHSQEVDSRRKWSFILILDDDG